MHYTLSTAVHPVLHQCLTLVNPCDPVVENKHSRIPRNPQKVRHVLVTSQKRHRNPQKVRHLLLTAQRGPGPSESKSCTHDSKKRPRFPQKRSHVLVKAQRDQGSL